MRAVLAVLLVLVSPSAQAGDWYEESSTRRLLVNRTLAANTRHVRQGFYP